jgi:quercetin dioxygenase-like cupin family protein
MGIVLPSHQLVDVRNEDALTYNSHGVAKLHSTSDCAFWYARLLPGMEVAAHQHNDIEDNALGLGGTLSYPVGPGQELTVNQNKWVVARPGETHGYVNRTPRPLTMLLFTPVAVAGGRTTRSFSSIFQPLAEPKPRLTVYETDSSRGEVVSLRPGETIPVSPVRYLAAYCLSGRIMCLTRSDRLALEASEGVCLVATGADLVGASGISTLAIFSTLF